MTTRAELDLITADVELTERLAAAKAAYRAKPTTKSAAELRAAKAAIHEHRAMWRGIREYLRPEPAAGDGVAAPSTVQSTSKVRTPRRS